MKNLPSEITALKNTLNQEDPWLILLDVTLNNENEDVLHLVRNTEDIEITSGDDSVTYTAFNFELNINKLTNQGQIPTLRLRISNTTRFLQPYLEELNGMVGSTIKITIINEGQLTLDYAELEQIWDVVQTSVNQDFVDFELSLPNLLRIRYPLNKFIANHCSHTYRLRECNYTGLLETCKRTFDACVAHQNTARYGGYPGLSGDGVKVV